MFNINDKARLMNRPSATGTIINKFVSETNEDAVYFFSHDSDGHVEIVCEAELEPMGKNISYEYEFEYLENLIVAKFYEVDKDIYSRTEIARGHGHIIHEGAKGIAQAASYALKKIYEKLNDGKI